MLEAGEEESRIAMNCLYNKAFKLQHSCPLPPASPQQTPFLSAIHP